MGKGDRPAAPYVCPRKHHRCSQHVKRWSADSSALEEGDADDEGGVEHASEPRGEG